MPRQRGYGLSGGSAPKPLAIALKLALRPLGRHFTGSNTQKLLSKLSLRGIGNCRVGDSMADFNLVPVPKVLLVQAGIFVANAVIVRKLLVEPYLRLRAKRLDYTERKQAAATARFAALEKELAELRAQRKSRLGALAQLRRKKYEQARARREELIVTATRESEAAIKEAKASLRKEFEAAQAELDTSVGDLSQEMFDILLPANGEKHARR